MADRQHFTRVTFKRFKAFSSFRIDLKHFNILVGPNNAGKSTILAAFRILAAALRKAESRKAQMVRGPSGTVPGHKVDLSSASVAEENIFFNYEEDEPATVTFTLSDKKSLTLYFPERGLCNLIPDADSRPCQSPTQFKSHFNCPIGFVPILGPVEHHEKLFQKEAATRALYNYRAARNFRNIWHHYPERFPDFREAVRNTWPGMDIEAPIVDTSHDDTMLFMFCPEGRIPREIFWSGFGFQVWCQMLTHLIQSKNNAIFLIDEPDIYLHSDLQRQLLDLLKNLGPDILIATHSTEIVTEADANDIVLVSKERQSAKRIKNPSQLEEVFTILGSNINPILTQLAKTRRVLFVEGKDYQILSKFAKKLDEPKVANRADFAVVQVEGFNPDRIKSLKKGMETTLGQKVLSAAILDRDFRSDSECDHIQKKCEKFCEFVSIHERKELENFLLVPTAIDRAAERKVADRNRRTGNETAYDPSALNLLDEIATGQKSHVASQYLAYRRRFEKSNNPALLEETINKESIEFIEDKWSSFEDRMKLVPGKTGLGEVNTKLQKEYSVNLTSTAIIDAMYRSEVPDEMRELVEALKRFALLPVES